MKPRTDKADLEQFKEGLIISSACLGGEIPRKLLTGDEEGAEEAVMWFKERFGKTIISNCSATRSKTLPSVPIEKLIRYNKKRMKVCCAWLRSAV